VTFAPDHLVTNAASIPELRMDASANSLLLLVPFLNTLLEFRSDRQRAAQPNYRSIAPADVRPRSSLVAANARNVLRSSLLVEARGRPSTNQIERGC